jgi:hypothetical protein
MLKTLRKRDGRTERCSSGGIWWPFPKLFKPFNKGIEVGADNSK